MQDSERPHAAGHAPAVFKHQPGYRLRRGRNWFFLGLTYAGCEDINDAERLKVGPVRACATAP